MTASKLWTVAIGILALSGCQYFGLTSPADRAATQASMTRIAEAVNATQGAIDQMTAMAPTKAPPTEKGLSFEGAALSGPALNVILGVWPLSPRYSTVPNNDSLCLAQCLEELWVSLDGEGTLQIGLFEFPTESAVVAKLRDIHTAQAIIGVQELEFPDQTSLPEASWIQDNRSSGSRYTLHTYQGRALIVITLYLPAYDQPENLFFLTRYGEKQIQLLEAFGW